MGKTDMTFLIRLAEEMAKIPEDKREMAAAMILGVCHGVQIADKLQQQATA